MKINPALKHLKNMQSHGPVLLWPRQPSQSPVGAPYLSKTCWLFLAQLKPRETNEVLTVCVNYVIFVVLIKVKMLHPICHLKSQRSHIALLTLASFSFPQFAQSHKHILFPLWRTRWAQLPHSEDLCYPLLNYYPFLITIISGWILQ